MKICRFIGSNAKAQFGIYKDEGVTPLSISSLNLIIDSPDALVANASSEVIPLQKVQLLAPVENQEVWAAGVTYLRSKTARMEESDFSATAYDKVYAAPRPELFFKALGSKVVAPGGSVGIRADARWNVPEPELALVINAKKELVGYTIGNDMSSRDIEGENLLYLPQAKIYKDSCALGPCITLRASEAEARNWTISISIHRGNDEVFQGQTSVSKIKREFNELIEYLFRSQDFPNGVILLTGTGVIPPDDFTLQPDDLIRIDISGIGTLQNRVEIV